MKDQLIRDRNWLFFGSLALLALLEGLRIYWIMPFPGSQLQVRVAQAYQLAQWIVPFRVLLGTVMVGMAVLVLRYGQWKARLGSTLAIIGLALLLWQVNGPMSAAQMFRQPDQLQFVPTAQSVLPESALVIGVVLQDASGQQVARAYPIQYIGYHHQVRDEVAGQPIQVTYCTVCRTGRVFSPLIDGQLAQFHLVGMDRFNAMFEDNLTGSWWRQANGEAVAGPLKGHQLQEIPSSQQTLLAWREQYPTGMVMAPDPQFAEAYRELEGYDDGSRPGELTGRDLASWQEKSWVVGIRVGAAARAFDWNELVSARVINDQVGDTPIALILAADGQTFRAFQTNLGAQALALEATEQADQFRDSNTGSLWSAEGKPLAPDGGLAPLTMVPAYQEFWHSWRTFQPQTTVRRSAQP